MQPVQLSSEWHAHPKEKHFFIKIENNRKMRGAVRLRSPPTEMENEIPVPRLPDQFQHQSGSLTFA